MYLFVFIWVPSLQEAHSVPTQAPRTSLPLPLGLIFSCFMVSMMIGSVVYNCVVTYHAIHAFRDDSLKSSEPPSEEASEAESTASHTTPLLSSPSPSLSTPYGATSEIPTTTVSKSTNATLHLHALLSALVCTLGALALFLSVSTRANGAGAERVRFWAFCVFEACVGVYYPVQGMLRGVLIANDHRATVCAYRISSVLSVHLVLIILLCARNDIHPV